jgi:hypothetical protein
MWLDFYLLRLDLLGCDNVIIPDDGSNYKYIHILQSYYKDIFVIVDLVKASDDPFTEFYNIPDIELEKGKIYWLRFPNNLGRPLHCIVAGWWRSFSFMSVFAYENQIEKLIHLESDCYILTKKLYDWLNKGGVLWECLFARQYGYPETMIQIIPCQSYWKIRPYYKANKSFFFKERYADSEYIPEKTLLFDWVEKWLFKGDRYGQDWCQNIPENIDWIANINDMSNNNMLHKMNKPEKVQEIKKLIEGAYK